MNLQKKEISVAEITGDCPICNESWKGESMFNLYRKEVPVQDISDTELKKIIIDRHKNLYQSKLFEIVNIDGTKSIYVCPFCLTSFSPLTN